MSVMILHIIVSLVMALGFLAAFIWAIRSNQYDDDHSPAVRMLFDDHAAPLTTEKQTAKSPK